MEFSLFVSLFIVLGVLCEDKVEKPVVGVGIKDTPATVKSKRAFYDTPYGQIHYKYGGEFSPASAGNVSMAVCYTFLLFHGNPRSTDEFTELIQELGNRFVNKTARLSYIAMDMFGEGHSDDSEVSGAGADGGYITMEQYSEIIIDITRQVFEQVATGRRKLDGSTSFFSGDVVRYIVPLGSLTGSAIAAEVSYRLKIQSGTSSLCKVGTCKILTTVLHDPMYYFSDQIVANVHSYADLQRKWQPTDDGQHLVQIWNDPNYQPYKDLRLQDRKSLDRFRAATTQWQVILSYADYSSKSLLGRLTALSHPARAHGVLFANSEGQSVPPLFIIYGEEFLRDAMMEKFFEVQKMKGIISNATKGGSYEVVVDGGNQALLSQNATVVADMIMKYIITL